MYYECDKCSSLDTQLCIEVLTHKQTYQICLTDYISYSNDRSQTILLKYISRSSKIHSSLLNGIKIAMVKLNSNMELQMFSSQSKANTFIRVS